MGIPSPALSYLWRSWVPGLYGGIAVVGMQRRQLHPYRRFCHLKHLTIQLSASITGAGVQGDQPSMPLDSRPLLGLTVRLVGQKAGFRPHQPLGNPKGYAELLLGNFGMTTAVQISGGDLFLQGLGQDVLFFPNIFAITCPKPGGLYGKRKGRDIRCCPDLCRFLLDRKEPPGIGFRRREAELSGELVLYHLCNPGGFNGNVLPQRFRLGDPEGIGPAVDTCFQVIYVNLLDLFQPFPNFREKRSRQAPLAVAIRRLGSHH